MSEGKTFIQKFEDLSKEELQNRKNRHYKLIEEYEQYKEFKIDHEKLKQYVKSELLSISNHNEFDFISLAKQIMEDDLSKFSMNSYPVFILDMIAYFCSYDNIIYEYQRLDEESRACLICCIIKFERIDIIRKLHEQFKNAISEDYMKIVLESAIYYVCDDTLEYCLKFLDESKLKIPNTIWIPCIISHDIYTFNSLLHIYPEISFTNEQIDECSIIAIKRHNLYFSLYGISKNPSIDYIEEALHANFNELIYAVNPNIFTSNHCILSLDKPLKIIEYIISQCIIHNKELVLLKDHIEYIMSPLSIKYLNLLKVFARIFFKCTAIIEFEAFLSKEGYIKDIINICCSYINLWKAKDLVKIKKYAEEILGVNWYLDYQTMKEEVFEKRYPRENL